MRFLRVLPALVAVLALSAFALPAADATVNIANESDVTIMYVYASPCEENEWGEDLLADGVLEPGAAGVITMTPGCWDLRAVTDGGQEFEHFGVEIGAGESVDWTISN